MRNAYFFWIYQYICTYIFFSFTLYPAYMRVGIKSKKLRVERRSVTPRSVFLEQGNENNSFSEWESNPLSSDLLCQPAVLIVCIRVSCLSTRFRFLTLLCRMKREALYVGIKLEAVSSYPLTELYYLTCNISTSSTNCKQSDFSLNEKMRIKKTK